MLLGAPGIATRSKKLLIPSLHPQGFRDCNGLPRSAAKGERRADEKSVESAALAPVQAVNHAGTGRFVGRH